MPDNTVQDTVVAEVFSNYRRADTVLFAFGTTETCYVVPGRRLVIHIHVLPVGIYGVFEAQSPQPRRGLSRGRSFPLMDSDFNELSYKNRTFFCDGT